MTSGYDPIGNREEYEKRLEERYALRDREYEKHLRLRTEREAFEREAFDRDYGTKWYMHDSSATLSEEETKMMKRKEMTTDWLKSEEKRNDDRSLVERLAEIKKEKYRRLNGEQLELRDKILEYEDEKKNGDIWDELIESVNKATLNKKDK